MGVCGGKLKQDSSFLTHKPTTNIHPNTPSDTHMSFPSHIMWRRQKINKHRIPRAAQRKRAEKRKEKQKKVKDTDEERERRGSQAVYYRVLTLELAS